MYFFTLCFHLLHFILQGCYEQEKLQTLSKQMELDRVAEEFKKLHSERQDLVTRWQVIKKLIIKNVPVIFHSILFPMKVL